MPGKPRCDVRHSHAGAFAVCAREPKHRGLCCPNDPPCSTCVQPPAIICARCRDKPTELEAKTVARLGGTHVRNKRRDGVVGMGGFHRIELCGPWVRADVSAAEAARVFEAWRARREQEVHR